MEGDPSGKYERIKDQREDLERAKHAGLKKFIVNQAGRLFVGDIELLHQDIAELCRQKRVIGGGYINFDEKRVYGNSREYRLFDPEMLKRALPGWTIG